MLEFLKRERRLDITDAEFAALVQSLPNRYRMIELQDRLIDRNDRIRDVERDWTKLTAGQRMLFLLAQFDMEVQNGGVDQFFWNQPGRIFSVYDSFVTLGEAKLVSAYESVLNELSDQDESWLALRERFTGQSNEDLELFLDARELLNVEAFDHAWYGEWDGYGTQLAQGLGDLLAERMTSWILDHPREFCTGGRGRKAPSA